jgi:acyl-CoA reductase-like NAD-dependent aldehyde dehydrogenase
MAPVGVPHRECYIGGKWVAPQSNKRIPVICPFTEEQIGTIPGGGAPEVSAAVSAANTAFCNGSWSKLTGTQRASYLRKIANKVSTIAINRAHACV